MRISAQCVKTTQVSMPKPNDTTTNGAIGVMQGVQGNIHQALSERLQHCVGQILHSRKLGAATRLLRSQNELQSLVKKWGSVEFNKVCFDMCITPQSLT